MRAAGFVSRLVAFPARFGHACSSSVRAVPRPPRDQTAGIRHVICRGNRRQTIFVDDKDRRRYLGLLEETCGRYGWRVSGYCLMRNHVHLTLAVAAGTISRGMQWLSGVFGQLFNRRHGVTGHLLQGRFRAEVIEDEAHAIDVVRYGDLNPVRARIVRHPTEWEWSSHRALVGLRPPPPFLDVDATLHLFSSNRDVAQTAYAKYVAERLRGTTLSIGDASVAPDRGQTPVWGGQPKP
jgi:REP element-mobilizing transposase RayT